MPPCGRTTSRSGLATNPPSGRCSCGASGCQVESQSVRRSSRMATGNPSTWRKSVSLVTKSAHSACCHAGANNVRYGSWRSTL